MIKTANMWRSILLSLCILAVCSVDAQSLQRKVFSPGGSVFTHNGQEYGFTIGEPMIGTDLLTIPYLTKGFQQPEPIYLLAPEITLHQVLELEEGIQLSWSASHHEQSIQYRIEYAIDGGSFVLLDVAPPGPSSQSSFQTRVEFPGEKRIRFKVIQELASGMLISSNELEIMLLPSLSWRLQPNPATRNFTEIVFEAPITGKLSVEIYTQFGQLVHKEQLDLTEEHKLRINTEPFAAGMYIVKIDHQNILGTTQLIVEK